MKGTVSAWFPGKGYGFISGEDGKDYFFHHSRVGSGRKGIKRKKGAFFEVGTSETDGREMAINVTIVEPE